MTNDEELFRILIGNDLSGVTFVRDYIQLQFNPPPLLNALTKVTVVADEKEVSQGERDFANYLISQVNKVVKDVKLHPGIALILIFEDESRISISLLEDDYRGAEAINFYYGDTGLVVL
jgi:hypothetical protein